MGTRTPDLLITNQLLYRLSYPGGREAECIANGLRVCKAESWSSCGDRS
jgi:hypothetical protein